ncbi:MAG: glutamine--fructose-6-phosphate transaminase (isomerizing) [Acidobacteriota bacterium]|jgi:glutamine---fructose-6-phosphate transaminase (isomerizing)
MCGIVGYIGPKAPVPILMEGLKRLEYRGYDSAGIATIEKGTLFTERAAGKIVNLEEKLRLKPLTGAYGVGHTRWATHGRPTEENAHPHLDCTREIVVVHNGIIENYMELKQELLQKGHKFLTETDTEVVAHMLEDEDGPLDESMRRVCNRLSGIFALVAASVRDPDKLVVARMGPPLVVGLGEGENYVASDIPAILHHTRNMIFLDDREIAVVTRDSAVLSTFDGDPVVKNPSRITWDPIQAEKAGFKHFMQKEIFEQPRAIQDTLVGRISLDAGRVHLEELGLTPGDLENIDRVSLVACGTSWHATLCGRYMIENLARLRTEVDYGSEFRYRDPLVDDRTLCVFVSQSGETADTLAAVREAKAKGAHTLAICNVVDSMLTREADATLYTHAGPEIGVASTKAFTTQLVALHLLALHLGQLRGEVPPEAALRELNGLQKLAGLVEQVLGLEDEIEDMSRNFMRYDDFLYLGRGIHYPIALEGALKLKEISYIHAEGYPSGEMKHGPIALIDENMPVVALAPADGVYDKIISNLEEVKARDGKTIVLANRRDRKIEEVADVVLEVPECEPLLAPVVNVVPLQLLAYHIAVKRGCDVDQPRNLAKSVTVE